MNGKTSAEVQGKGVFSSGYVSYKVAVADKGWVVERRFKDFFELRRELIKHNPGSLIPPVHDFTVDRSYTPELISQTKEMLQDFLDSVLRHPLFGSCELVYYFLHYPCKEKKADEFPRKLKAYATQPMPTNVEDMKTVDGEARIAVTKETAEYISTVNSAATKLKASYQE